MWVVLQNKIPRLHPPIVMASVKAAYKGLCCLRTEPAPFLQGCELPAALAGQQGAVLSGASWPEAQPPAQMAPDLNLI